MRGDRATAPLIITLKRASMFLNGAMLVRDLVMALGQLSDARGKLHQRFGNLSLLPFKSLPHPR
jgi:hypothetical protein